MNEPALVPTGFNLGGSSSGSPQPGQYDEWFRQAAEQEGIDPVMYRRQGVRESNLNPNAVSPRGAKGIMQFMDPTAQELGIDPFNAEQSIFAGARYMRQLGAADDYAGAAAKFNWGLGNVQRQGLANAPQETRDYVEYITGKPFMGGAQAMAVPGQAAPANDQYPSYTDALGNVITRASPTPDAPPLTPTGFNLATPDAPPPLAPTGFNLNAPETASPYDARTPLPPLPPQWTQDQQPQAPPVTSAATMPVPGQAPPTLATPSPPPGTSLPLSGEPGQAPPITSAATMPNPVTAQAQPNFATMVPNDFADPNRKADPATPWKPETGWGETALDMPKEAVAGTVKYLGGTIRALGENQLGSGIAGPGVGMTGEQLRQNAQVGQAMAKSADTPGSFAHIGKQISDHAEQVIIANTPNVPRGSAKDIANKVGTGILETVPALLGSMATGTTGPMIASAAISSFGTNYADEMAKPGADPHQAALKAGGLATVDAAAAALMFKAFEITPFKGVSGTITNDLTGQTANFTRQSISNTIKNLMVQGVAIQPAIGLVNHGIDNVINGRPVTENMGEAYVTSAISNTLVSGLAHLASGKGGLTQVGKFEKPQGEAYPFNPAGINFPGEEIGTYYAGGKPKPQTLRLPAPAQAQSTPATAPTTTGEQTDGLVQTAANAKPATATPVSGEDIAASAGAGGQPQPAGGTGNQAGGIDTAPVSGPSVPAAGTEANGNAVPATEEIPKAALTVPQDEPAAVAPATETVAERRAAKAAANEAEVAKMPWAEAASLRAGDVVHPDGDTPITVVSSEPLGKSDRLVTYRDDQGREIVQKASILQSIIDPYHYTETSTGERKVSEPAKITRAAPEQPPAGQAGTRPAEGTSASQDISGVARPVTSGEEARTGPQPAAAEQPAGTTFTTAKGSTYEVHPDGTTTRNKAARTDVGHEGQSGPQPRSEQTYYVTAQHANALGLVQATHPEGVTVGVGKTADGQVGVKYLTGKDAGKFERSTVAPAQTQPAVGLTPVETWKNGTQVHFGNEITKVNAPAEATTGEAAAPREADLGPSAEDKAEAPGQEGAGQEASGQEAPQDQDPDQDQDQARDQAQPQEEEAPDEDLTAEERQLLDPEDRETLDLLDRQIERRTASEAVEPTSQGQVQLKRQIEYRNALVDNAKTKLAAKTKIPRRKAKVDMSAPPREGAPKTFTDYKFGTGTPVFRDAFVEYGLEHGHGPNKGMTMDEALVYADRAINFTAAVQVSILLRQVQSKFAFKDVHLSDKLDFKDARDLLLDFHRAAQDMMHGLGLPVEMASLDGKASLALEPSNKKQYGSYTPATKTITMNGRASVFGHEWMHAFDHNISETIFNVPNPQPLATQLSRAGQLNPADQMSARMGHLMNSLFYDQGDLALEMVRLEAKSQELTKGGKPTPSADKARRDLAALQTGAKVKAMAIKLSKYYETSDKFGAEKYWTHPWELMARAGEAYIAHTMTLQGLDPRGVVMPDEAYLATNDRRLRETFPHETDRAVIIEAFNHLMDGYRQEVLAGSIAAAQALRGGTSDPSIYSRLSKDKKQVGAFKELIYRIRNMNATLQRTALTDPLRPDPGLYNAWHRSKVWASSTFNSRMGFLEGYLADKAVPDRAKVHLRNLMDRIGRTHGTGRYTGWSPLEERQNRLLNKRMYQLTNILMNNGFDPESITKEQNDHLHHAMTTGEDSFPVVALEPNGARVPIDPAVSKAAKELRGVHDEIYHDIEDAKMEIGYAESAHFPRLYDQVRSFTEPEKFLEHAAVLHREMFDEEVGEPGKHPEKLADIWSRLPSEQKRKADNLVGPEMRTLQKNLSQQRELEPKVKDGSATQAEKDELDRLEQEAKQIAIDSHDALGDHIAKINADIWLLNQRKQRSMDYDQTGPGGNFLNKRELPPQTDRIMRDFMITDVLTALPRYYEATSRRIAQAERFGPKGEILEELFDNMLKEKMQPDDVALVRWVTNSLIGKTDNNTTKGVAKAADYAHSTAAVGLMGRSAYITAPEPFTLALAHRNMRAGLISLGAGFGEIMRTMSSKERSELAEFIGVVKSAGQNEIIMNRVGHDYSDSPRVGKFMAMYYAANLITGWTNFNSRATMAGSHYLLKKWSGDLLNMGNSMEAGDERDTAHRKFNELGIHPNDQKAFAKEILSLDGPPNKAEVEKMEFTHTYSLAMYRLVKSGVLDPTKMERPMLADEKWPGLALQFLNYAYTYQRTVLDPAIRDVEYATQRRYGQHRRKGHGRFRSSAGAAWKASEVMGKYAWIGVAMVLAQIPATMFQQWMFNNDAWEKHQKDGTWSDWIWALSVSRSSFGGTADAPVQAVTSLKYDAGPSTLTNGASMRWIDQNLYNLTQWGAGPSAKESGSNVRAHEGVKSLYNMIGIPLEAFAAVKLTGFGPIGKLGAASLLAYGTSQQAATRFADMVTGPKGAELPEPKHGLQHLPKRPHRQKTAPEKPGTIGMQNVSKAPLGFADDIMVPAWKMLGPVVGAIPSKLKWAMALGALGYQVKDFIDEMEPFRNAPPPKEKEKERTP